MIATMPADRWFRRFGKPVDAQRRLVCFHHAGGGASLFRDWHGSFPADTEVLAAAIPGRETRIAEAPLTELRMLAAALVEVLPLELPFAFFGHSLGGVVSFELARQLHQRGLPIPQHLFVSACPAPHLCRRETSRAQMSDEELLRLLEGFGGTPREILAHPEFRQMVLTTLRADFNLIDEYAVPADCDVRFPMTAYAGREDHHVRREKILAWERWAEPGFVCQPFDGDHFYLTRQREALIGHLLGRWDRNLRPQERLLPR
jgi:surfactin synthase thioesterase subunit